MNTVASSKRAGWQWAGLICMAAALAGCRSGAQAPKPEEQTTTGTPEPKAKNQAKAADTIFVPPDYGTTTMVVNGKEESTTETDAPDPKDLQRLRDELKKAGLGGLTHLALVDAEVDADGCMAAPLTARLDYARIGRNGPSVMGPSDSLLLMADLLRAHGITVTVLQGAQVEAMDRAEQARLKPLKSSYSVSFSEGRDRYFATAAERNACLPGREKEGAPHPALAAALAALHQDAVLAIQQESAESQGPRVNIIEGALSSSGKDFDEPKSQAEVSATLVLKNGQQVWGGKKYGSGKLTPAVEEATMKMVATYIKTWMARMEAYHKAHPKVEEMPAELDDKNADAIFGGKLEQSPDGTTLGPSIFATRKGVVAILYAQFGPALGGH